MKSFRIGMLCAVLLVAGVANAGTGTASLTSSAPTTNTNGSELKAKDITGYLVECAFTPNGGSAAPCTLASNTITGSTPAGTVTLTYPAAGGKACFQLRTLANGTQSALSPLIDASCKDFAALVPNAPGPVTVTVTVAVQQALQ